MNEKLLKIDDISDMTRDKIMEILDVILYTMEMAITTNKDIEKKEYINMPFGYKEYEHLAWGDIKGTYAILETYLGESGFKFAIGAISKNNIQASWNNLHKNIKEFKKAIKLKRIITNDNKINEIAIVKPTIDDTRFVIIINQNFDNPLECDLIKQSWNLLFQLATKGEMELDDRSKGYLDYFNTNKKCKLYTQTGLAMTKILKINNGFIKPNIKISAMSEKSYKQKIKEEQKDT